MKRLLIFLLCLVPFVGGAQSLSRTFIGSPSGMEYNTRIGGYSVTKWMKVPRVLLTLPAYDSAGGGQIAFDSANTRTMWYHNGTQWVQFGSGGGGSGTVTSITAGYGLNGGTITTSGTIRVDTTRIPTRRMLDSVANEIPVDYIDSARLADTAAAIRGAIPSLTGYATTAALADSVSGRVPYRNADDSVLLGEYPIRAGQFNLDLTPTAPTVVGGIYWDVTNVCPSIPLNADVTLQVGQEVYVRARNNTGVTISNGKVVYINSAQGNNPTLALADADDVNTSQVIGVATEDISDNATGFVTVTGVVNGVNTSGYNAGDALYLDTINGGLTKQLLSSPHNVVFVGYALNSTNNGRIFVRPSSPIAADTTMDATGNQIAPTQEAVKKYVVNTLDDSMAVVRDSLTDIRSELNGKGNGTVTSIQVVGGTGATVTPTTAVTTSGVYTVTPEVSSATYNTLTNKRITYRTGGAASYTTSVTIAADSVDMFVITAQAGALLFNAPSGTPTQGQMLLIRIKDSGGARALTWNAIWRSGDVTLPTTTTINKTLYMEFLYNTTDSKWDIVGKSDNY
jgi:hypothetical protein